MVKNNVLHEIIDKEADRLSHNLRTFCSIQALICVLTKLHQITTTRMFTCKSPSFVSYNESDDKNKEMVLDAALYELIRYLCCGLKLSLC